MVPRTYPSTLDTTTANRQMVAYSLPSISGLVRWVDYIPIKISTGPVSAANTYNNDGYIPIDFLSTITGRTAWVDYIPVYVDAAATDSWQISSNGFIPYAVLGTAPSIADDYYKYVSLLLNTTSTNGAQNNTFLDSSTNAFSVTRNGNTTQGNFSPFSQTGWSNYFDGTGDYLNTSVSPATLSGNFTIEGWVYIQSLATARVLINLGDSFTSTGVSFYITTAGRLGVFGNNAVLVTGTTQTVSTNTWVHVAFVRSSNTIRLYVDGVADATTLSNSTSFTGVCRIGAELYNTSFLQSLMLGYISNARIVAGIAVYTANFTPPTTPLQATIDTSLLTCQSNRFIDNSINAFNITRNGDVSVQAFSPFNPTAAWSASTNGGSGYFDGTGDYLSAASDAAFALPAAFTFEVWLWPVVFNQTSLRGDTIFASTATSGLTVGRTDSGTGNRWGVAESNVAWRLTTTTLPTNAMWNHMVVVRDSSNNMALFLNGTRVANATVTTSFAQNAITIGSDNNQTGSYITGYMSGMRLVKGTAVYDPTLTTLTVPTAPLTAIANTSLLLNFTNAGIYDSASGNDLETVGNAQVSTVQSKWGTTSMAFDGTGDSLTAVDSPRLELGAADFTIEMWAYYNAVGGASGRGTLSKGSTTGASFLIFQGATNELAFYASSNGTTWDIASAVQFSSNIPLNTWHHLAVTRSGSTFRVFLNGTQTNTFTSTASLVNNTAPVTVGAYGSLVMDGYIDDLRITNGYARYTANFTPPTAAFPTN